MRTSGAGVKPSGIYTGPRGRRRNRNRRKVMERRLAALRRTAWKRVGEADKREAVS